MAGASLKRASLHALPPKLQALSKTFTIISHFFSVKEESCETVIFTVLQKQLRGLCRGGAILLPLCRAAGIRIRGRVLRL